MRYAILFVPLIALLALACADGGGEPSATAPAGEVGGIDLVLRPEDMPLEIAPNRDEVGVEDLSMVYNGPSPYPEQGARFALASIVPRPDAGAAHDSLLLAEGDLDRSAVEQSEAQPGFDVLEYQEPDESIGEESRIVVYISIAPDDQVRLENYRLVFRRGRAVALIEVTAPEGNVTLEQVIDLAETLDGRIQEGLQ